MCWAIFSPPDLIEPPKYLHFLSTEHLSLLRQIVHKKGSSSMSYIVYKKS